MIVLVTLCVLGLLSGFLLMMRIPICGPVVLEQSNSRHKGLPERSTTLIIPARNEEHNLPQILGSIPLLAEIDDVFVIDDGSTDRTKDVAEQFHARVINPGKPLPSYTGKAWACTYGAAQASSETLLFLDADTFFETNGLRKMLYGFANHTQPAAMSVLPFAVTRKPYEELSLFFNLMMAFGAGGFGLFQSQRLFGQSLILSRELYQSLGGHSTVGHQVLENFHLSRRVQSVQARTICFGGLGTLNMRMFPDGPKQLWNGWLKAFADGANATDPRVLGVTVTWLSALSMCAFVLPFLLREQYVVAMTLYLLAALQVLFFARQIGSFRILSCFLFPIPLLFFFVLFGQSVHRRRSHRTTNWRGREV